MKTPSPTDDHLFDILTTFDALSHGQGDAEAGANLLVARAVTLANLSRPGSGIRISGSSGLIAGCNLLVSGALSSSLVGTELVGEVAARQNVLTAHLRRLIGDKIAEARKAGSTSIKFPGGPAANAAENTLYQLEQKDSLAALEPVANWTEVLACPPNPRIDDLAARPRILVTATGPKDLGKHLNGMHGNRTLVVLGLNRPSDAAAYADICNPLLNGPYPIDGCGETVMANLLVIDPCNMLARIAPNTGDEGSWLGRMVWLVDGKAGGGVMPVDRLAGAGRGSDMDNRFVTALLKVLAKRLNNRSQGSRAHEFALGAAQLRWMAFLKEMEGRLPGIVGTARSLLATLAFGLIELSKAAAYRPLEFTAEGVEAMGRWIVGRMAHARLAMQGTAELERMLTVAKKLVSRIDDEGITSRELYRALSITASFCEELLRKLEPAGLVRREDNRWKRGRIGPFENGELEVALLSD